MSITRFEIIDHRPCGQCNGSGWVNNEPPIHRSQRQCPNCEGLGTYGRNTVVWRDSGAKVTYQEQDNGQTLKVFIDPATHKQGEKDAGDR